MTENINQPSPKCLGIWSPAHFHLRPKAATSFWGSLFTLRHFLPIAAHYRLKAQTNLNVPKRPSFKRLQFHLGNTEIKRSSCASLQIFTLFFSHLVALTFSSIWERFLIINFITWKWSRRNVLVCVITWKRSQK